NLIPGTTCSATIEPEPNQKKSKQANKRNDGCECPWPSLAVHFVHTESSGSQRGGIFCHELACFSSPSLRFSHGTELESKDYVRENKKQHKEAVKAKWKGIKEEGVTVFTYLKAF